MMDSLFPIGQLIAIIGCFIALFWAITSTRYYWRRRRRGITALIFIGIGVTFMVISASNASSTATPKEYGFTSLPLDSREG